MSVWQVTGVSPCDRLCTSCPGGRPLTTGSSLPAGVGTCLCQPRPGYTRRCYSVENYGKPAHTETKPSIMVGETGKWLPGVETGSHLERLSLHQSGYSLSSSWLSSASSSSSHNKHWRHQQLSPDHYRSLNLIIYFRLDWDSEGQWESEQNI